MRKRVYLHIRNLIELLLNPVFWLSWHNTLDRLLWCLQDIFRTFCVLRNKRENRYDVILIIKTNTVCFSPPNASFSPPLLRPFSSCCLPGFCFVKKVQAVIILSSSCGQAALGDRVLAGCVVTDPPLTCRRLMLQNLRQLLFSSILVKLLLHMCYTDTWYLSITPGCSAEWKEAQRSHLPSPGFLLSVTLTFPAARCHRNDLESKTQWAGMTGAEGTHVVGVHGGGCAASLIGPQDERHWT